jgi:hypothetical protein
MYRYMEGNYWLMIHMFSCIYVCRLPSWSMDDRFDMKGCRAWSLLPFSLTRSLSYFWCLLSLIWYQLCLAILYTIYCFFFLLLLLSKINVACVVCLRQGSNQEYVSLSFQNLIGFSICYIAFCFVRLLLSVLSTFGHVKSWTLKLLTVNYRLHV